jgi:hypothetical protein
MTIEEAARLLKEMVDHGHATKEVVVQIHLFGIRYAEAIDGMPLGELTARAGISDTYKTEIRKAINLARYVQERPK